MLFVVNGKNPKPGSVSLVTTEMIAGPVTLELGLVLEDILIKPTLVETKLLILQTCEGGSGGGGSFSWTFILRYLIFRVLGVHFRMRELLISGGHFNRFHESIEKVVRSVNDN